MRVIVVGNGLAGIIAAKTLRELDKEVEIDVFAEEKNHYYPRPNLIEYIAGSLPFEKIFAYPEEWYKEQRIKVHFNKPVKNIRPESQEVEVDGGKREKYDALFLANGSFSFIPPFEGVEKQGVFSLRTLDDANSILEYIKDHKIKRVGVIGGGLLGLEIARALSSRGVEVDVVEYFGHLLPRQLDEKGSAVLVSRIEKMGTKVHLGLATEEIFGREDVDRIKFKDDSELKVDMVVIAAGIRPDLKIAQDAGIKTDSGLIVDDYLQTSVPNVFAAGDVVEHRGKVYGIIPATFDQARRAVHNILGKKNKYEGTVSWNTLKVAGLYLTSVGLINSEKDSQEEIVSEKSEESLYKKIILEDEIIVGAIWMGTKKGIGNISRAITQKKEVGRWKDSILKDDFDFSVL